MTSGQISREDIEGKFRQIQTDVTSKAEDAQSKIVAAAAAAGIVLMLLAYLFGRRSGKKKSTIVEIRRL